MAQIESKHIDYGTGSTQVNSQKLPANYTPANYTPVEVGSEGTDKVSAHLKGISNALSGGAAHADDISPSSFSGANNQSSAANVTGLAFSTANSFEAQVSIQIDATANLYEVYKLTGIKKDASWDISQLSSGDDSDVVLSITSGGQVQYTSANYAGFSSLTFEFRADAL